MPTPQWKRDRAQKAKERTCTICGVTFSVTKTSHAGKTCSKACLSVAMSNNAKNRVVSDETKARISAAQKRNYADPAYAQRHAEAARSGIKKWHSDPDNAAKFAKRASDRMKRLHADPDFQVVRDVRSSETMKRNWEKYRGLFTAQSIARYQRMIDGEYGLWSKDALKNKKAACKWIMQSASEAMHNETNYNEVYAEVQARIRSEQPPEPDGDYYEYLKWLGTQVVSSRECMEIANAFMALAIPRFAKAWNARKAA